VARLHSRGLDRSRPLWELYVIEGLDNVAGIPPGCFAVVSKMHHAAIDGASFNDIGSALCDLTPEIRKVEGGEDWKPDKPPSPFELAALAYQNNALKPLRYMEFVQQSMPTWMKAWESILSGNLKTAPDVPRTRFNGTVSPHRVFEGVVFSLDEIKQLKNTAGGTVNDAVLAICSGALRKYLLEKDELPESSLVSMCPVSIRDKGVKAAGGNQVISMAVPLHTELDDPAKRMRAIHDETRNAKELTNALGAKSMAEMINFMPTQLSALGARVAAEQGLANFTAPTFNAIITNVPGSQVPLYSNGALHIRGWGLGPVIDGNGLFHSVGSYCGELTIGVTSCREMMPDPARYAELLYESFEELKAAFPMGRREEKKAPAASAARAKKTKASKALKKKSASKKAVRKTASKKTARKKTAKKAAARKKAG
jgi:WS/DGAT/MGAT family acyltransferase